MRQTSYILLFGRNCDLLHFKSFIFIFIFTDLQHVLRSVCLGGVCIHSGGGGLIWSPGYYRMEQDKWVYFVGHQEKYFLKLISVKNEKLLLVPPKGKS